MNRGTIVVDKTMKTNLPDIYAAGDCVQVTNRITGAPQWSPMGSSHLPGETGPVTFPSTVLLRIEFTAPDTSEPAGELLPHLSTLTCW